MPAPSRPLCSLLLLVLLFSPVVVQAQFRPGGPQPSTVGAQSWANTNRVNPNFYVAPGLTVNQAAYNTARLGNAISHVPPYAMGYNPYVNSVNVSPGYYGGGGWGGYGGWGYNSSAAELASAGGQYLSGAANLTAATGQYYQDVQQARITREQSRQAHIETQRQQMEFELEYEKNRPTAPKMLQAERTTDIDYARRFATPTDIWSGKVLNVLYQSILGSPRTLDGPTIPLDPDALRGINLNTKSTFGGLGLLKDAGKLPWPLPLQDPLYDDSRKSFDKNFEAVARGMESASGGPNRAQIIALKDDLTSLSGLLDGQVKDLSPSEYIGSRRFLNEIKDTIKALSDPTLVRSAAAARLPSSIRTVTDLVAYMRSNGLAFAPAVAVGDQPAYTSTYYALRAYETAVSYAVRTDSPGSAEK
jgi:hypothetical protein